MAYAYQISHQQTHQIIQRLSEALAGTYILYLNTQKCHWNIRGHNFYSLHLMFDTQYKELAEDVDVLAERIRMLDAYTPATFKEFETLSPVSPLNGQITEAQEMLHFLVKEYEKLIKTLHLTIKEGTAAGDHGSADIALQQSEAREKTLWMLKSSLA